MSDPDDVSIKIRQLTDELNRYNHYYHNLDNSLITDEEFDRRFEQLKSLEEQYPEYRCDDSPTGEVACTPVSKLRKITYETPMMGLNNVYDEAGLRAFIKRLVSAHDDGMRLVLEPKLDGLAVRLLYRRGILKQITTRGSRCVGEDILRTACKVEGIPYQLTGRDHPEELEIRGEIVADLMEYQQLNDYLISIGQRPYSTPRNFVSGNLRQTNPKLVHWQVMRFFAYDVIPSYVNWASYCAALAYIHEWGVATIHELRYLVSSAREVEGFLEELTALHTARDNLPYDIDGAVLKVDDFELRKRLGTTQRSPRWGVAYKYPAKSATTPITSIEFTVGRTGVITPVVGIKPIHIGGVQVASANVHTFSKIQRLGLDVGDVIKVIRAGDVIPDVVEVVQKVSQYHHIDLPTECPFCDTPLKRIKLEYYCPNHTGCREQQAKNLVYYASRDAADIQLMGPVYVRTLLELGVLARPSDYYRLSQETLEEIIGRQIGRKLYQGIQRAKGFSLDRFLVNLGIHGVGPSTATAIASHWAGSNALARIEAASVAELEEIPEVGPTTAKAVHAYFQDPVNRQEIAWMVEQGVTTGIAERSAEGPLKGQVWCISGQFYHLVRKEIKTYLQAQGATLSGSVTGKTTHLLLGEEFAPSKVNAALKHEVVIIDNPGVALEELLNPY